MSPKLSVTLLLTTLVLLAASAYAQNDATGKVDTVTLKVQTLDANKWMVTAFVWNDEELAAVDIPIRYTAGMTKVMVDSVSFKGTRMEKFAQKYFPIDTAGQMMHFGGLAYMSPEQPPLVVGSGEMARVYFSLKNESGAKKPGPFAIDTCTMAPNSSLMLVDKNAKIIVPALKIINAAAAPASKEVPKEAKKEVKKETPKEPGKK